MKMYEPLPGENEIIEVRKFPYFLLLVILRFIIRSLIPLFFGFSLLYIFNKTSLDDVVVQVFFAFYLIYMAFLLLLAFIEWLNEELDLLIVTDQRIIIFIQETLFKRHSSIASLDQIQDVKGFLSGILFSLIGIGTLEIQTAADKIQFVMEEVRHPEKIAHIINNAMQKAKHRVANTPQPVHLSPNPFL
ncbi:hypothetical protein HON22_01440, partial [Candidatus Peregrinibacteria bacterium]|nr:hypothetical protein [Candidatus Peregrinibacteria bacterium]